MVYDDDPAFDKCIIDDMRRGSLIVSLRVVYIGDPPIATSADLASKWHDSSNTALKPIVAVG